MLPILFKVLFNIMSGTLSLLQEKIAAICCFRSLQLKYTASAKSQFYCERVNKYKVK